MATRVGVRASVQPVTGGPPFVVEKRVTLAPAADVALVLPKMPVKPGTTYTLTVTVDPPRRAIELAGLGRGDDRGGLVRVGQRQRPLRPHPRCGAVGSACRSDNRGPGGCSDVPETITITDNRTGDSIGDPDPQRGDLGRRMVQVAARYLVLRPRLHGHRGVRERDHLSRRRGRDPALPRLSDRGAGRELDVPRGRVSAPSRRASERQRVRQLEARHHVPHVHPRERTKALLGGLPLRRPSDGHARLGGRRPVDLLLSTPRRSSTTSRARSRSSGSSRRCRPWPRRPTASASACRSSTRTTRSTSRPTSSR